MYLLNLPLFLPILDRGKGEPFIMENIKNIQYDNISKLSSEDLSGVTKLNILFDETNPNTVMATLLVKFDTKNSCYVFEKSETYSSLKEFSTVVMKELITLYSKRTIIASDPTYYINDDPKLHSFLSKLSYPAVESVAENLEEFSKQFKTGHVSLSLGTSRRYKNQPLYRK